MTTLAPDLENATAQEVLAYGVEKFHPRLTLACSFQKEESVLFHMLSEIDMGGRDPVRAFTIDTGVLFAETLATWKRFEDRFGLPIDVLDAHSPGEPWTAQNCCGAAKVDALERGLAGVDAWITGIRREQSPTRAAAPKLERDERRGIWKLIEHRFGLPIDVLDAHSPGEPWTAQNCCGAAKVDALERGLAGVDAWITGIRREQSPTRAAAPKLERDERRGIWKLNPLADWSEKDLWRYIFQYELPYNPLHDEGYASIGCAPCTLPGAGRDGRWAGEDKTECGIHE